MKSSARDLAARIWSAFPVTQQAFAKLDAGHRDRERVDIEPAEREQGHLLEMI